MVLGRADSCALSARDSRGSALCLSTSGRGICLCPPTGSKDCDASAPLVGVREEGGQLSPPVTPRREGDAGREGEAVGPPATPGQAEGEAVAMRVLRGERGLPWGEAIIQGRGVTSVTVTKYRKYNRSQPDTRERNKSKQE